MRLSLKSTPKWLWIPPAVALLLVLGPLSMQGTQASGQANEPAANGAVPPAAGAKGNGPAADDSTLRAARPTPTLPRTPDLVQMASALVGVLLLGVGGLFVLRKLRGGVSPARGAAPVMTLRQTLRLSARQAVHAIEFDDRILLVGEHERGLTLVDSGRLPDRASDEATVLARHAAPAHGGDEGDEGAVPKDLVIPRPPQPARAPVRAPAPVAARTGTKPRDVDLNDFRTLLQKVGRS